MKKKKVLMLGASIFFIDAYKYAKKNNIYTVAVDLKDENSAICKKIADVSYVSSTRDIDALIKIAKKENIDGIYAGASETNMPTAIELASILNIPFYCEKKQWNISVNKRLFKEMCVKYNVPIVEYYDIDINNYKEKSKDINFPVVTKPVDNNGSTGITICNNRTEFLDGYCWAVENSKSSDVLVEKYMPYDSVIIHYTMANGKAYFCGMSDKKSKKINQHGAPIMSIQFFPSDYQQNYLKDLDKRAREMFEKEGFKEGPIWIEAFTNGKEFIFNEMGYRFGGSMTYHPVEFYTGINQIKLMMDCTLSENNNDLKINLKKEIDEQYSVYSIVPIHIRAGNILTITGVDEIKQNENIHAITVCHVEGDKIENNGTVSQVFCYLHIKAKKRSDIEQIVNQAMNKLSVKDEEQKEMLFRIN